MEILLAVSQRLDGCEARRATLPLSRESDMLHGLSDACVSILWACTLISGRYCLLLQSQTACACVLQTHCPPTASVRIDELALSAARMLPTTSGHDDDN